MKTGNTTTAILSREQISARAFQLWEEAGRPGGRDLDFWLRAEAELLASLPKLERAATVKKPLAPKAAAARKKVK